MRETLKLVAATLKHADLFDDERMVDLIHDSNGRPVDQQRLARAETADSPFAEAVLLVGDRLSILPGRVP